MSEHLLKLLAAYAAGTAATAFTVSLVWLAPLPDYTRQLLSWLLPLPAILMVLVMLYYGPQSSIGGAALPDTPGGMARVLLMGTLSAVLFYAIVPAVKFIIRRATGDDEDASDE